MNKADFLEWKSNSITKQIFNDIQIATQEVLERSKVRDTVDKTAMQVCHDEGFIEGIEVFIDAIEDMELEVRDE